MNRLKEKLAERNCNIRREEILDSFEGSFAVYLRNCRWEFDSRHQKNLAYPKLNDEGKLISSRGLINSWRHYEFRSVSEVKSKLAELAFPLGLRGWLTLESDVPFFEVDGKLVQKHFSDIVMYVQKIGDFDISWVCEDADCGFIVEQLNQKGNYEFSVWGL